MTITVLGQALATGLLMGGVYALVAAGVTIIFGVMDILNFAQGALLALGMYASFFLFASLGMDPYLSLVIVTPLLFVVGYSVQRVLLQPILSEPPASKLLVTMGLNFIIINALLAVFGAGFRTVNLPYANTTWFIGEVGISVVKVIAFAGALLLNGALFLVMEFTDLGRAMRAAAEEPQGAQLIGVNVRHIYAVAFGLGAAASGAAGALLLPVLYVSPSVANLFLLVAFIIVVLGGMGNLKGAVVGGLIIGVTESLGAVIMPGAMKQMPLFVIFILVLLFRPKGLFGR